jgi:transcriptional regulator with XRE-family HTH domain
MKKTNDIREKFGFAIKAKRAELKISQEQLAEKAGLHRTYVGDIERGERNPSLINIERIAKALGFSLSDLFKGLE